MLIRSTLGILLALTCISRGAGAQEAQSAEQQLRELDQTVRRFSSENSDYRLYTGVASLGVGAVTIPAGVAMMKNDAADPLLGRLVVLFGISEVLVGGLQLTTQIGPGADFEALTDTLDEERAAGRPAREIVSMVETQWREAAAESRWKRRTAGVAGLALGAVGVAGGLYLTLKDQPDMTTNERYGYSAALLGLGFLYTVIGMHGLFVEEPIEATWHAYERGGTAPQTTTLRLRDIGYAPVVGGGTLQLQATF